MKWTAYREHSLCWNLTNERERPMTLNPDDFVIITPRFNEVVDAYVKGDKLAIVLIENGLNLIADLGYLRSGYDGEDYYQIRAELDEYVDAQEGFFKHFNIKALLQEHQETEQTFEDKSGGGKIIQFPGNE